MGTTTGQRPDAVALQDSDILDLDQDVGGGNFASRKITVGDFSIGTAELKIGEVTTNGGTQTATFGEAFADNTYLPIPVDITGDAGVEVNLASRTTSGFTFTSLNAGKPVYFFVAKNSATITFA